MRRPAAAPRRRLRWALALTGLAAALAAAAGIPVRASYAAQTTGDEPHYLLTAVGLAEDGDLDLSDEFAAERYRPFHEVRLDPQGKPAPDGRLVAPHDPLLPALLAGPMAAGGWVGAKLTLAVLNGTLAALMLWTAVRRFSVTLGPAAVVAVIFGASAPFAVYGSQVYPELAAAVAVAIAIAALTGPLGRAGVLALAASLVALPWLSTKYVIVAVALALVGVIRLVRGRRPALLIGLTLGLAAMAVGLLAAHWAWYGGWTPYAAGSHFSAGGELSVVGYEPNFLGRSSRLIGLLADRSFGLAAWQPAWLLALPALAAILRRRPAGWETLALPLGASWATAAFLAASMHGWWWPGRHVVAGLPAAVLAVAWWADGPRWRLLLLAWSGALGVVTYGWVVADGLRGRLTWAVDFFTTSGPVYRVWRLALPDYMNLTAQTWILHGAWILAAVAAAAWGGGGRFVGEPELGRLNPAAPTPP